MLCANDVKITLLPLQESDTLNKKYSTTLIFEFGKHLLQCAKDGNSKGVIELLAKGAPFTTDWLGTSPLHLAAMNNHYETCEVLLRAGIVRDGKTKVDRTALHFAAYEGHSNIIRLLLRYGSFVDSRDMLFMTPLHWAVEKQHMECIKLLLENNADPRVLSKFDKSPISIAIEAGWTEAVDILTKSAHRLSSQTEKISIPFIALSENEQSKMSPLKFTMDYDDVLLNLQTAKPIEDHLNSLENDLDADKEVNNDLASLLPPVEESPNEATLKLMKEHGITMLPADNSSTINTALQSGRKIVLSDAGKLVLKDVNLQKNSTSKPIEIKKSTISTPSAKFKNTKIIAVNNSKIVPIGNNAKPNILQKLPNELVKKDCITDVNLKSINNSNIFSQVKIAPLGKNIKIVNGIPLKTLSVVKNSNGEIINPTIVNNKVGQTSTKIVQVKSGYLENTLKLLVQQGNTKTTTEYSNKLDGLNGAILDPIIDNVSVSSLDKNDINGLNVSYADKEAEINRLKSELAMAKQEVEFYKKKFHEADTELAVYKSRNCHSMMEIESNSID